MKISCTPAPGSGLDMNFSGIFRLHLLSQAGLQSQKLYWIPPNATLCCLSEDGKLNSVWQNKRELNLEADKMRKPKEK